ncbi:MAG: hypothetical protein J3Q66DRAFT_330618 [Benniella sp.]|nr:MAG: hypothetical protein J3Q66DRAFT_330618 [Benniella sp.]
MMFDYPELVAQLALYMSPQDLARCSATCKSFASLFEPYLYRHVTLNSKESILPIPRQYTQHIRTLVVNGRDVEGCLEALAQVLSSTKANATLSTTADNPMIMRNLKKLVINSTCYEAKRYSTVALNTVIGILNHNCGIIHLEIQMHTVLEDTSIDTRLLESIRTGLPRLQRLIITGGDAFPVAQAMEALKVCLGHPSLTDVQFYTQEERQFHWRQTDYNDMTPFESLLEYLNELDSACEQIQGVKGSRLTSLALPHIPGGHPRSFLLPLLRTYLPLLKRFQIPKLNWSYEGELEEVIAGHCRNLQHISYTFPEYERYHDSRPIKAAIRGCARWSGLKSIRVFGYNYDSDRDSRRGLFETMVEYHSKTLESVELQEWRRRPEPNELGLIFIGCPNLKSFKVWPSERLMDNVLYFVDIPAGPWVFQGLKELRLHFSQNEQYPDAERAKHELEAGRNVFEQIGKLVYLESLALDYFGDSDHAENDRSIGAGFVKEIAGLEKLRYLYMPPRFWDKRHLSTIVDSSWPRLERISVRGYKAMDFRWLKERRPWLKIGELE